MMGSGSWTNGFGYGGVIQSMAVSFDHWHLTYYKTRIRRQVYLLPFISAIQRELPGASLLFPRDLPVDQNLLPCAFTHNQCSEFPLDRFLLSPHFHAFCLMIDLPPMLGHVPKIYFPFSREGKFDLSSSLGLMSVCHS